jgi:hypothetical protein
MLISWGVSEKYCLMHPPLAREFLFSDLSEGDFKGKKMICKSCFLAIYVDAYWSACFHGLFIFFTIFLIYLPLVNTNLIHGFGTA